MCSDKTIIEPKQARSKRTQEKLLVALHECLQHKFFEHISIEEIAKTANVSVGSYYRRFKNKQSLLPMLYEDFSVDICKWLDSLEDYPFENLHDVLVVMNRETCEFLTSTQSVFRTLHISSRIYSEFITPTRLAARRTEYTRLRDIILRFEQEITHTQPEQAADMVVHNCVNSLMDKVIYPNLTPAIACPIDLQSYLTELVKMQFAYLTAPPVSAQP